VYTLVGTRKCCGGRGPYLEGERGGKGGKDTLVDEILGSGYADGMGFLKEILKVSY